MVLNLNFAIGSVSQLNLKVWRRVSVERPCLLWECVGRTLIIFLHWPVLWSAHLSAEDKRYHLIHQG
jgi:hypothetical protein